MLENFRANVLKRQSSFKIPETRESSESFQKKRRYGSETEFSSISVMRRTSATNCNVIRTRTLLCTDARMSDGCSSKIVKLFSMPNKNSGVKKYTHSSGLDFKEKKTLFCCLS